MLLDRRILWLFCLGVLFSTANAAVSLYYTTTWEQPYMHYSTDGVTWTTAPGEPFVPVDPAIYPGSWYWSSPDATELEFVPNDGQGHWDHPPSGSGVEGNYFIGKYGSYFLKNGVISHTHLDPCPEDCGEGICDTQSGVCICPSDAVGPACEISTDCPVGPDGTQCSGNGTCLLTGVCFCDAHFATCATDGPCATDLRNDDYNCGKCGAVCAPDATLGVATAFCLSSSCVATCADGLVLCPDNSRCVSDLSQCPVEPLPGCQVYDYNNCPGQDYWTPESFDANRWQTPGPNADGYRPAWAGMSRMVSFADTVYAADHKSATVSFVTTTNPRNPPQSIHYVLVPADTSVQPLSTRTPVVHLNAGDLIARGPIEVYAVIDSPNGNVIEDLKPDSGVDRLYIGGLDFVWNVPEVAPRTGDYRNGQKGAVVDMFMWPYADIAKECAFIGAAGYLAVKISPPQETVLSSQLMDGRQNPWYFSYQPVSYHLDGRGGSRSELREMVYACRQAGVRVVTDLVVNHFIGAGNDISQFDHRDTHCVTWPSKSSTRALAVADGASPAFSQSFGYHPNPATGQGPIQEFPAAALGPLNFHCSSPISSWTDPHELNFGWLSGLVDVATEQEYVRQRIAAYCTDMLSLGVSGFRMDAAKHICPTDLGAIYGHIRNNMGGSLPPDFKAWLEVLIGGEADLLLCNANSGYSYSAGLVDALKANGLSDAEVDMVTIWYSAYPKEPYVDCGMVSTHRLTVQLDDHDQSYNEGAASRDMGNAGSVLVHDKDIGKHRGFEVQLFSSPPGAANNDDDYPIRVVLSGYWYGQNGSMDPPDGLSDCSLCEVTCTGCKTRTYNAAYVPGIAGYSSPSGNDAWTRVHRDRDIINAMRGWIHLPALSQNDFNTISQL
jgi:alpha-amylase